MVSTQKRVKGGKSLTPRTLAGETKKHMTISWIATLPEIVTIIPKVLGSNPTGGEGVIS